MGVLIIDCNTDKVSDGVHTFSDMYAIRDLLFIALMRRYPEKSFRSLRHDDGSFRDGMFVCGITLPTGKQVTLHMKEAMWTLQHGLPTPEMAPKWDGHRSGESLGRLEDWLEQEIKA